MSDKKISQLTATTTPVSADLLAIVQSGTTKKITFGDLKAGILNSSSLTSGVIPYWDGSDFADSPFSISGGQIVTTANIVSTDNTGGLAVGVGGYSELSSSNFDSTESFVYVDPFEAAIVSQGINGLYTDAPSLRIIHGTKIVLDAPLYNFLQSTASTVPYFDASKNLVSSSITPTELGYLSGVTSAIQTQLNSLQTGQYWKAAVRVATLVSGTLASSFENGDTVDSVVLATGDRILIKNQSSSVENGIYIVNASGAPTRATDFDSSSDNLSGATVTIKEGSQAETKWTCSTNDPITIGVSNITFVDAGGLAYLGTTNRITVTGNVIDISASYVGQSSITTLGTIGTGVWQGTAIGSNYGGAGTVNGILKANGSGIVSLAVSGTDYITDSSTNTFTNKSGDISQWTNDSEYAKQAMMVSTATSNPGDGVTYYIGGGSGLTLNSNYALRKIPIYVTGNISTVIIMITGIQGTSEISNLYVRVNDTTDYAVTTFNFSAITAANIATYISGLTIPVTAGDTISFKFVGPTWATNPSSMVFNFGFKVV